MHHLARSKKRWKDQEKGPNPSPIHNYQMHQVSTKSFTSLYNNKNLLNLILDGCTPKRKRRVTIGRTEESLRQIEELRSPPKEKEVKLEDLFAHNAGTLEFIA